MEQETDVDAERSELEGVIRALTPLRQHRQAGAERVQHRAQMELTTLIEQLSQIQVMFSRERLNLHTRRQDLANAHLQQNLKLNEVNRWHDQERRITDRLGEIRQDIHQHKQRIDAQEVLLEQARQNTKLRQHAVEKLACLNEALYEEG